MTTGCWNILTERSYAQRLRRARHVRRKSAHRAEWLKYLPPRQKCWSSRGKPQMGTHDESWRTRGVTVQVPLTQVME